MSTPSKHLFDFEREVHRLIEAAGVSVTEFFDSFPSMKDAKWTTAHFSYGQGKSAEQGAADWFAECVKPHIARMSLPKLDAFTRAYVEAALWSSTGDDDEPLDSNYTVDDLAPELIREIIADCAKFQAENAADIAAIDDVRTRQWTADELAGHDFWLTRNGHGAGFWDRGLGEIGERLTAAAHAFGEADLYIGDNGLIYS